MSSLALFAAVSLQSQRRNRDYLRSCLDPPQVACCDIARGFGNSKTGTLRIVFETLPLRDMTAHALALAESENRLIDRLTANET